MANTFGGGSNYGNNASLRFPNFNIPEKEKDEAYHKKYVEAITNYSINSSYDMAYAMMNESYEYYDGTQSGSEFSFLQEAEDGEVLPAQWINFNKIKVKVDLQLGELDKKGYELRVRATNKEAIIRRHDLKESMRVDMRINPVAKEFEQEYKVPLGYDPSLPENDKELDMKFDSFQDKTEVIMEYALKFLDKKYKWRYTRIALFRDMIISGRAFVKCEIVNGYPTYRRIDPRNVIFDINSTDDFLSDSTFFGEIRFMGIADAAHRYGLDEKEIEEVYNSYTKDSRFSDSNLIVDKTSGSSLSYFKRESGELRVLVLTAYWQDYKKIKRKFSEDKYGHVHVKVVEDTKQDSESVKSKTVKTWRTGTQLGGKIMREWGELANQVRSIDDWYESDCPIKACVPNFINKNSVSKVQILKSLQKLKNITLYNIQLSMSRAGGKGMVYDVSQIPDEWDLRHVMKYLKVAGIAFIDSRKDGIPAQYNQFSPIDQTISDGIRHYLEINKMVDAEMDAISGINDARQGQMQGASQAVGVTQAALVQSNLATETMYSLFQMFSSNMWTHLAGLTKIAMANKEKFVAVIGETGINFLEEELKMELDDYATFVEEVNPIFQDVQMFHQLVTAALQSQQIGFLDAMKLMKEKDVTKGIREYEKASEKHKKEMQMMQQQAAAEEHQKNMELQQATMEGQAMANQVASEGQRQLAAIKNAGDLAKENIKGKVALASKDKEGSNKLRETAVKGRIDLRGKQIDAVAAAKKEQNKPKPASKSKK
jgi:hypothetical protein